jgi:hypothetical protein
VPAAQPNNLIINLDRDDTWTMQDEKKLADYNLRANRRAAILTTSAEG